MSSVEDYYQDAQLQAQRSNYVSQDDDPDEAAEAVELSNVTGVPAPEIHDNLDDFKRQHKLALANGIINDNQYIQDYLNFHPLAASVSHDDLGQLDEITQALGGLTKTRSQLHDWLNSTTISDTISDSFMRGYGDAPLGSSILSRPADVEFAMSHPAMASVAMALATPPEFLSRAASGLISLGHDGIEQVLGGQAANDLAGMAEWAMTRGDMPAHMDPLRQAIGGEAKKLGLPDFEKTFKTMNEVAQGLQLADQYTRLGKEPPIGIHPLIDKAKEMQAKEDMKQLDDAVSAVGKSATRDRSPDMMTQFLRGPLADRTVNIDAEAIRALYGDKVPAPDDGILGWVPGLADSLPAAEAAGASIPVPIADFLAKTDPEAIKALHDNLSIRDGVPTLEEAKIKSEPKTAIADPVASIRASAGLEPLAMAGDRKISLQQKVSSAKTGQQYAEDLGLNWADMSAHDRQTYDDEASKRAALKEGMHDVDMLDESGNQIGTINLSEAKGGKQLYIEMINAGQAERGFYQPNFLGPGLIRDVKRQLKEMFPNAETITGHRVTGARDAAGGDVIYNPKISMPVVKLHLGEDPQNFRNLLEPFWQSVAAGGDADISVLRREDWTPTELAIRDSVEAELQRIAPTAKVDVAHAIDFPRAGGAVRGMYQPASAKIFVSLENTGAVSTARHEAIHFLARNGFFTDAEWDTLAKAAKDEEWGKKFDIDDRYANFSEGTRLEESIAEAYQSWKMGEHLTKADDVFQKLKDFLDTVLRRINEALGRDLSWEDLFKEIDTGRVGRREFEPEVEGEGALAQTTEEGGGFGLYEKGKALGVTQAHMERMERLIEKRNKEDFEASQRRAELRQRRRSNADWKARRTVLRDEVREQLAGRPDIATDQALTKYGVKLHPAYLSEEQRARLPKDYIQQKNGVNPDDLAPYFGYTSGDALVERLGMYTEDRRRSGMSQRDYFNRLVDVETDRRLNAEFGDREQHILEEAKDQALSETQLRLVHEDTLAYALKAGQEPQFTHDQVKDMVREAFAKVPVGQISSDRLLQNSLKVGKKIEEAGAKGKWDEAYRLSQQRQYSVLAAKLARDYERDRRSLDRTAKTFRKREVPSVPAAYTNWIHDLLVRTGYSVNRSVQDLAENIQRQSSTELSAFVREKAEEWAGQRDLPIAEFIQDAGFQTPVDQLTHEQFKQFKSAIDMLVKAGRDEGKIYWEGQTFERAQYISDLKQQVEDKFSDRKFAPGYEPGLIKKYTAGITSLATVFRRFDGGERYGKFAQITNRMAEADNYEARLDRETAKDWTDITKNLGDLSSSVDDQHGLAKWNDVYTGFTHENKLSLIHNAGNIGNWRVAVEGWGGDVESAWQWLVRNSTKEEWDAAQAMGDRVFTKLAKIGDGVYERVTGATVEKIPLEPFTIKFPDGQIGEYKGWYYPLIEDNLVKGKQSIRGGEPYTDYGHTSTANGWTKARTGAIYPVDLSFGQLPFRMSQMIHDITHREAILETQKIFKDTGLHNTITKRYGKEYTDLLMPWLEDASGKRGVPAGAWGAITSFSNTMRSNAVSTYIGFNPSTPMKHAPTAFFMSAKELGWRNMPAFLEAYKQLHWGPDKGYYRDLVNSSEEIQRRDRHWQETFGGAQLKLYQKLPLKQQIVQAGAYVVAKSDRFSADALWLARRNLELADHGNIGLANAQADLSVRRAHGTTAPSNLPELVRRSAGGINPWLITVYGFMGERFQRLVETAHIAADTWGDFSHGDIDKAARRVVWDLLPNYLIYVAAVGAVEEGVNAYFSDSGEGPVSHLAKIGLSNIASSFLYLRDMWHAAEHGQAPTLGMTGSVGSDLEKALNDIKKGRHALDRQQAGKTVRDLLTVGGLATGKMPKTLADAIGFGVDYANHIQVPKTPNDWIRGITRGQTQRRVER